MDRRTFLQSAIGAAALTSLPLHSAAQKLRGKVKITDVKCMIVRGTWDWNLIKIETDAGVSGIGEAYWGWGVKDLVLNKLKPIVVGEDPAQRRQAVHEDADAERRRGRDRGRHGHGGERHRDRAVGSGRPAARDAGVQPAGRTLPRSRAVLSHHAGGRSPRGSGRRGASRCAQAKAEKFGWTAFKFQGDGIPPRADPELQGAGPRPLHARAHAQGSAPHRHGDGNRARGARTGRRLRRGGALEIRRARRHQDGQGDRAGQADVARRSGAAGQSRGHGARDARGRRPDLHRARISTRATGSGA